MMKSKKKIIIIAIVVVIIAGIIGIFLRGLYQVNWSMDKFGKILSNKSFKCFIKHDFKEPDCFHGKLCKGCGYEIGRKKEHTWLEATCANPKTCSACGTEEGDKLEHDWMEATCTNAKTCWKCRSEEGEPLEHTWIEATCTKAKTCSVCETKEGVALGHTTRWGTCERCNLKIVELWEQFIEVYDCFEEVSDLTFDAGEYIKLAVSSYYLRDYYVLMGVDYMKQAAAKCRIAIEACGDYAEFAEVKNLLVQNENYLNTVNTSFELVRGDFINALHCQKAILGSEMFLVVDNDE